MSAREITGRPLMSHTYPDGSQLILAHHVTRLDHDAYLLLLDGVLQRWESDIDEAVDLYNEWAHDFENIFRGDL